MPPDAGSPPEAPQPPAAPPAPPAAPPVPPAASATPPVTEPPKPPATGDEALGEPGLRALKAERDRAEKAEKELADLRAAGLTDQEKAIDAARKAAAAEERVKGDSRIRRSEVRSALRVKGLTNEKALDLAVNAPEFAALKVDEDGSLLDLAKTVDQFVKEYPEMFAKASGSGDVNRGPNDGSTDRPATLEGAVAGHYQAGRS